MDQHISFFGQVFIYLGKCLRIFRSQRGWKNFISTAIILFLITFVIGDDMFLEASITKKGAFAIVCACLWTGIFNSIRSVCSERAIIKREYRTGLRISSYVVAHVLYEMILCLGECIIIIVMLFVKYRENIPEDGALINGLVELFIDFYLILVSADVTALFVSCMVRRENTAMTIMPLVLIVEMVFAGMIFELEGAAKTISAFMISRWGLATICVTVNLNELPSPVPLAENSDYTFTAAHQLQLWGLLVLFTIVFTIASILVLRQVDKDKR